MGLGFFYFRKCKIVTNGPWLEVPPVTLWDISIIPSSDADDEESVALWAISDKGDVLCRLGVTQQNPAVRLPVYFYCLIDVFNVITHIRTRSHAVSSLKAPHYFFFPLCPRFESPSPLTVTIFCPLFLPQFVPRCFQQPLLSLGGLWRSLPHKLPYPTLPYLTLPYPILSPIYFSSLLPLPALIALLFFFPPHCQ